MRALHFPRVGHPLEVLELVDLPEPEPGPGELLVEVLASPIAPMDRLQIRGRYPLPTQWPGAEGVGRVLAHGQGVEGPPIGSRVLLPVRHAAWRERLTMAAEFVVVVPERRALHDVATARIEALSASVLLDALGPHEWFVHSPGAGSVGRHLTALASRRGLHSIALVGSREPIADLWGLGADHVFVREAEVPRRVAELGLPIPRIGFDGSGGATSELLAGMLEIGGELIVYGGMGRRGPELSIEQFVHRNIAVRGFWLHRWALEVGEQHLHARLQELLEVDLRERIAGEFALDDWRPALELAEHEQTHGRVLFRPVPE